MTRIHAIRTGLVQVRRPQMESRGRGPARLANMLFDEEWSGWLPVYAWAIEHDEGIIVVDTGETSRVHERGYHPRWHPFYRRAVHFSVHPEEELGPQLRARGIDASRRPAGRAHAPPHRPCGRAVSCHRKPRVGLARRIASAPAESSDGAGLSAAPLAEMVAAGIHPLRAAAVRPF